jgi:hypothetical protein
MGCGGGIKNPYEECAFLLREYELILKKRKNKNNIEEKERRNLDNDAKQYKKIINENLNKINKNIKTQIEIRKLKELNALFQVLLTEESEIYDDKNEK